MYIGVLNYYLLVISVLGRIVMYVGYLRMCWGVLCQCVM